MSNTQDLRANAEAALITLFLSYGWHYDFSREAASNAIETALDIACND